MARSKKAREEEVKNWCDQVLLEFNRGIYLDTDPISLVHRYKQNKDRELVALISALFAYGNVRSIISTLNWILEPLGDEPSNRLQTLSEREIERIWKSSYYRFYAAKDVIFLMKSLREMLQESGTLEGEFKKHWNGDVLQSLSSFRNHFWKKAEKQNVSKFMFPDPQAGAAKRWHMFLRWLVRKDEIDLGLWSFIPKSKLIQPLDTHLFEITRKLGLTSRNTPGLAAALEVTEKFKSWDPHDPLKYDFALCRIGVLKRKGEVP